MSLCIDDSRYDIDKCHEYREDINREGSYHEHSIFLAEIGYWTELHTLKALHAGKKIISCDKERDLQKKGSRALKSINRLIVIDLIVFLEHHEALIALKSGLDVLDHGSHPDLDITLFGLKFIGALIEREDQEVNCKA